MGTLQFPMGGSTYQHGLSCAWVLITEPSKVLNVTFTAFNLEQSVDCKFDFLQVRLMLYIKREQLKKFIIFALKLLFAVIVSQVFLKLVCVEWYLDSYSSLIYMILKTL